MGKRIKSEWSRAIINVMATLALLCVVLTKLADLMENKYSDNRFDAFFRQEEDFDVLFMGTSHVINGIFPMELWNQYGIVSYNFGTSDSRLPTTYWIMENALDYTVPELIVIDCYYLSSDMKHGNNFSHLYHTLDAFPLSLVKVKTAWDILEEERKAGGEERRVDSRGEKKEPLSLLWNYSIYHTRWNEIGQGDFDPVRKKEKGAEFITAVETPAETVKIRAEKKLEGETKGTEYLRKMIEDCQKRGIRVLLIYLPFPACENDQMEANRVLEIAEEYQVDYINFLDLDVVDYGTDCFDAASHLNVSGGRKVTDYLGEYLSGKCGIPDRRGDSAYSAWYGDYEEYTKVKRDYLKAQTSLRNYLMLLAGDSLDAVLEVGNTDIFQDSQYVGLLENLGADREELNSHTDFIIIKNGGEQAVVWNGFSGQEIAEDAEWLPAEAFSGMRIVIRDAGTGDVVDRVDFEYTLNPQTRKVMEGNAIRGDSGRE